VLNLAEGSSPTETARTLEVSRTTVSRVAWRFREAGEAGLVDRREENGSRKLDDDYLGLLWELVERHAQAKVIHVILDNYAIHTTRQVELSLRNILPE